MSDTPASTPVVELVDELRRANIAYSRGTPFMSDEEYHILWRRLHAIDPDHPALYHTAAGDLTGAVTHPRQVLAPQKAFCEADLATFLERYSKDDLIIQPKYDGCAIVLFPQADGTNRLVREGDGVRGTEIVHIPELPIKIGRPIHSQEACELVIPLSEWDPSLGANPRNVVAGWLGRTVWPAGARAEVVSHEAGPLSQRITPPYNALTMSTHLLEMYHTWGQLYPIDGIMLKVADSQRRLVAGHTTAGVAKWSIAWKPPIQTAPTIVRDIEWEVSRQGRVIPTILHDPIDLCGTTNRRVTANNAMWLQERGVAIGSSIIVGKAGDIIPQLIDVAAPIDADLPAECPACGGPLYWENRHLMCDAPECPPRLAKRFAHAFSESGVYLRHLALATLQKLLADPEVSAIVGTNPFALLRADKLGIWDRCALLGGGPWQRFWTEVEGLRIAGIRPAEMFAAMGLPSLGKRIALDMLRHDLHGIPMEKRPSGTATESYARALSWFASESVELIAAGFHFIALPTQGATTFAVTGTLSIGRAEFVAEMTGLGWQFHSAIKKTTQYLVLGETGDPTAKERNATRWAIPIIDETQARVLALKENPNG